MTYPRTLLDLVDANELWELTAGAELITIGILIGPQARVVFTSLASVVIAFLERHKDKSVTIRVGSDELTTEGHPARDTERLMSKMIEMRDSARQAIQDQRQSIRPGDPE